MLTEKWSLRMSWLPSIGECFYDVDQFSFRSVQLTGLNLFPRHGTGHGMGMLPIDGIDIDDANDRGR